MPEIGEVARIVHYIRQNLVGKTLAVVKAQHDENVFGKVGTSAAEFEKALTGKKVLDANQQGKYFWLEMSSPPHPLCHFGMAGWFKIRGHETDYYKPTKPEPAEDWPPKYWKFSFTTLEEPDKPVTEAAFVDKRRFARVRLIDCPTAELRSTTPLKENGPDPIIDKDIVTEEWLAKKCAAKKLPIKALLLDQGNISGIGNWVGDEILYHAHIHPEQYSNTLSAAQISQLHTSLHHVCGLAVSTLADSSQFPATWLFKHRWDKGKKGSKHQLPNGAKIVFLTVGGRTSAVVPSVQKKTGPVAGDVKKEDVDDDAGTDGGTEGEEAGTSPAKKRKATPKANPASNGVANPTRAKKNGKASDLEEQDVDDEHAGTDGEAADEETPDSPPPKKRKTAPKPKPAAKPTLPKKTSKAAKTAAEAAPIEPKPQPAPKAAAAARKRKVEGADGATEVKVEGRRRSARVSGGAV